MPIDKFQALKWDVKCGRCFSQNTQNKIFIYLSI